MSFAHYQSLVDSLVRHQSTELTSDDRNQAIALAVSAYGADAPRELVEDVTWLANGWTAALPTAWAIGSYLVQAEYPIGQQPPNLIEMSLYHEPTGWRLITPDALTAGSIVRVTFVAPHVLSDTAPAQDTIPTQHREAVAAYAAYLLCRQLAAYYSGERESSINADGSNTDSRARNYAARANDYKAMYYAGIGKADPQRGAGGAGAGAGGGGAAAGQPAASVGSWGSRSRLTDWQRANVNSWL